MSETTIAVVGATMCGVGLIAFVALALMRRGTGDLVRDYAPVAPIGFIIGIGAGLIGDVGVLITLGYGFGSAASFPVLMVIGGYPRPRRDHEPDGPNDARAA
jgi:hypothetical protein